MPDITIPRNVAEKLIDLYTNIEAADAHFQRCQSDNFRLHIKSVYQNPGVKAAFEELQQQIETAAKQPEPTRAATKPRKGVLSDG